MINIKVTQKDIDFAKNQIAEFVKIEQGKWRYSNVETWRGVVCEMLTSKWLEQNYKVDKPAKGLDTSGVYDDCDMVINSKKVEIKAATKNYFKYIMPKVWNAEHYPKDVYVGVKYNETVEPNQVLIVGFIKQKDIKKYPIKKNKGGAYYEIPLNDLKKFK
jgi:hypothetical protein